MADMLVKDIMTKNPETLEPNSPIQQAAEKMKQLDCGFMPIAKNEKIVGIVTDRDITIRAVSSGKNMEELTVEEIMTPRSYHVYENDDIKTAAEKMRHHQVRRLVVLNKDKNISGIISLGDIATKCKNWKLDSGIIEDVSEKKQFKKAA